MIFLALALVVKPFYMLPSGSFQVADLCMLISFILIVSAENFKITRILNDEDKFLRAFLLLVVIINLIYSVLYGEMAFLKSSLYMIFGYMVIIVARKLNTCDVFMSVLKNTCKINIIVQLVIYILKLGKWFEPGRYMATYNDPNQFAFAISTSFLILYCIQREKEEKSTWLYFIMCIFLVVTSASMGSLLLIAIFIIMSGALFLNGLNKKQKTTILITIICLAAIMGMVIIYQKNSYITEQVTIFSNRLDEKIDRFTEYGNNGEKGSFFELIVYDRNLRAAVNHPISFLYGSGEGLMSRFAPTDGELHSTWIALLFYYGVIPTSILIWWIINNLKNVDAYFIIANIAMFAETWVMINYRQPTFWLLIILGSLYETRKKKGQ